MRRKRLRWATSSWPIDGSEMFGQLGAIGLFRARPFCLVVFFRHSVAVSVAVGYFRCIHNYLNRLFHWWSGQI
jgi:hypothetical protein